MNLVNLGIFCEFSEFDDFFYEFSEIGHLCEFSEIGDFVNLVNFHEFL